MNNIIKIITSLDVLSVLTAGVTETVKNEIKKQEGRSLGSLLENSATSLM